MSKVFVFIIMLLTLAAIPAYAENCTETRCVDGRCEVIPRYDLPGCDHPDDNFSVSNLLMPMSGYNYQYPEVITFLNGYHESFSLLLDRLKKGEAFTDVQTFAGDLLGSSRLLVIPSGGLNGLENSNIFKALLDEFVKQGGILLVFGQQHGYSFSVLPTPADPATGQAKPIASYGWSEDQSCTTDSVYIDTYHQVLSGQSRSNPSLNVDGYFMDYPADATILLRRTINSQPAMLMYDYGEGKVIVTSMYSDWAFGSGQASQEEISLVRDLVSWAKSPNQLPEIKAGETVTVSATLVNNSSSIAAAAKIVIYNPDKTVVVSERTVNLAIPVGSSSQATVQYFAPFGSALGIYHLEYSLLDAQGTVIQLQAETESGRFAVSSPAAKPLKSPDFSFSVNANSESFAYGSDAVFTLTMFNNTDKDRTIKAVYFFPHHYWETGEVQYGGDWGNSGLNLKNTLVIPAKSSANFNHVLKNARASFDRLWSYYYDENNNSVGMSTLGFYVFWPKVDVAVKTDKTVYNSGETVNISSSLQNRQNVPLAGSQTLRVIDPSNTVVYATTLPVALGASAKDTQNLTFTLPSSAKRGFYTVVTEIYGNNSKVGGSSSTFEIPLIQMSITPTLPPVFDVGVNALSFSVTNVGKVAANSASLNATLKAPDGSIVTNLAQPFALGAAQSITLDVPLTIPSLKFGVYTLSYTLSNEASSGTPISKSIASAASLDVSFDKSSYRIRDTATFTMNISNTGLFSLNNARVTVSVPDAGYTDTKTVSIAVNEKSPVIFSIPIPVAVVAGQHSLTASMALESGSSLTSQSQFTIPGSLLSLAANQTSVAAGTDFTIAVRNDGGVDTDADITVRVYDKYGVKIIDSRYAQTVLAADNGNVSVPVPVGATDGVYRLEAECRDVRTGKTSYLKYDLTVDGSIALVTAWTDKQIYFPSDVKTASVEMQSLKGEIKNANLNLKAFLGGASAKNGNALVIKDANPWGLTNYLSIFTTLGIQYDIRGSSQLDAATLSKYSMVMIVSDQSSWTYGNLVANKSLLEQYVQSGGVLLVHAADGGWSGGYWYSSFLPGGVTHVFQPSDPLHIEIQHPVVEGLTDSDISNLGSATHGYFTNLVTGTKTIVTNYGKPTYIEYAYGSGLVLASTQTLEWAYNNRPTKNILVNEVKYAAGNGSGKLVWEKNVAVASLSGTSSVSVPMDIPSNLLGKFNIVATLTASTSQFLEKGIYDFYLTNKNIVPLLHPDKYTYKLGDTVTFTGAVVNNSVIEAKDLVFRVVANGNQIYSENLSLAAGEVHPFTASLVPASVGVITVEASVADATMVDRVEVFKPAVSATVVAPDSANNENFDISVTLTNSAKVDALVSCVVTDPLGHIESKAVTVTAGGATTITYAERVSADTTFTISITGDAQQTIVKTVKYGLGASVSLPAGKIYAEGKVAIPVTVTNTGLLDGGFTIDYQLTDGNGGVTGQTKTYYLPKAASTTGTLYFDVTEGTYQLIARSQLPTLSATSNFAVRKETKVDLGVIVGTQDGDLLPVSMQATNLGYNPVLGFLRLSLLDASGTAVWSSTQDISMPFAQNPAPITSAFNISLLPVSPGNYSLKGEVLNGGNEQLAVQILPLSVKGALFTVTQTPSYQTFQAGSLATMIFKVKNTGTQEGAFELNLKADDLMDTTRTEWLKPGEEKEISYSFMPPADSEAKDFFANYTLKNQKSGSLVTGVVSYHLAGINLSVNASLDQAKYNVGDTALLTLVVSQDSPAPQNLFAKINYNGYEEKQAFTANPNQTLSFSVPLSQITGAKLTYGIYYESGRSIHLNSVYIYQADTGLAATTDKQVYTPGEMVTIAFTGSARGELTFSGPGDFNSTFSFTGSDVRSFALPLIMTAGTYTVSYSLTGPAGETIKGSVPFDVQGILVKVMTATLDKAKYAVNDTVKLNLIIESNQDLAGTLKTWVLDSAGNLAFAGQSSVTLTASAPLPVSYDATLAASASGIHRLVYGIFKDGLVLSSGSVAFDVGDATILGVSSDKANYPYGLPVTVTTNMFGSTSGSLEVFLDGASVMNGVIDLAGFGSSTFTLAPAKVIPGFHTLKAVLSAGGVISSKETTFTYGSKLPEFKVTVTATPDQLWPPNYKMVPVILGGEVTPQGSDLQSISISVIDEYGKYSYTDLKFGSTVLLEAWRDGKDMDGRIYTVTAVATDKAGNKTTRTTTVTVPHDMSR